MPASHSTLHLVVAAALCVATATLTIFVRNRVIRRRLFFSTIAPLAAVAVHAIAGWRADSWLFGQHGRSLELLVVAVAAANGVVALLFNPWFRDGESDRAPAIVQDTLVVACGLGAGLVLFEVSSFNFLTGSAIVAAVIGFALQDTLGNAFAGIAIQIERPFRVGQWITVSDWAGLVTEVTWRATRIRTKAGNIVSVPNSLMANHAITNLSEPSAPTRLHVEVGAAYGVPPNEVREALLSAARQASFVLPSPAPQAVLTEFASSSIVYRVLFWVEDFTREDAAKDSVRTRTYYEFRRRGIEIPWPIQVEYSRQEAPANSPDRRECRTRAIAGVPVFALLSADEHAALATGSRELLFADDEVIVSEGTAAGSMFIVLAGAVAVTVGSDRRQVAVTETGGYFGEMSLLTGEARTATVRAQGDCTLLEIGADAFRMFVRSRPEVIDQLALTASVRRRELDGARTSEGAAPFPAAASLRDRMREFFGV